MKASYYKPFLLALLVIVADQAIKTWVRMHMYQSEEIHFWVIGACCITPKITAWPLVWSWGRLG
ncbi:hypothetical protein [Mucilaginibacter antarcticus]|uniref:hypothetical protein n=1 Tax=Mucilaginibacter antarcticus TaxID=1855725 RepID=UPI00363D6FAE